MEKGRERAILHSIFGYFQKITDGNLYYSKVLCEFLLQKNATDGECSNLRRFIKNADLSNFSISNVFRNINFASEYRVPILREIISGINESKHQFTT